MRKLIAWGLATILLASCASPAVPAVSTANPIPIAASTQASIPVTGHQTYTVLVGAQVLEKNAQIEAFLPATLHIHPGDTVVWKLNTKEIHTVVFPGAGKSMPPFVVPVQGGPAGAMTFNPQTSFAAGPKDGNYDGSVFATSGILGPDQPLPTQWSLTFTKEGTYSYSCNVHDMEKMNATIIVDPASTAILSPEEVTEQGKKELADLTSQIDSVVSAAHSEMVPDKQNADGTTTHTVMVGYMQGQIDLMDFYPADVKVKQGDSVVWVFSKMNMAPHTITFLNGAEEPPLGSVDQPQNGPPVLNINPAVAAPMNANMPLTEKGVFSSGLIDPTAPGDHTFTIKIGSFTGSIPYLCELHDDSGMKGTITMVSN